MKKIIFPFALLINTCVMFAQENEFEGVLHYKSEIRSKVPEVSNKSLMTMMLFTDTQMTLVKKGNYKIIDPKSTIWYKPDEERVYYKFKGIDTLYFQEYGDDSTEVKKISKSDQLTNIGNFKCKSITLQTDKGSLKFYYSPDYKLNPSYDKNNKIGRFDVFAKETGSIRLGDETDKELYSTSQVCTKLEQRNLDPHEFDLPKYPVKKLVRGFLVQPPRPKGDEQGWTKYLQLNLDPKVSQKYVRLRRGEKSAQETVQTVFIVGEKGEILKVKVLNEKEVHSKLVEEAVRVISESPRWTPATILGEKCIYMFRQDIVFRVEAS